MHPHSTMQTPALIPQPAACAETTGAAESSLSLVADEPAAASFYDAVAQHHAGKLRLRHALRRMAEGGAAIEASEAQAACLKTHWLRQVRHCSIARGPALDELEDLNASLLQMQTHAVEAAQRGHATQALLDLADLSYVRLSRRLVALLSELHLRAMQPDRVSPPASTRVLASALVESRGNAVSRSQPPRIRAQRQDHRSTPT